MSFPFMVLRFLETNLEKFCEFFKSIIFPSSPKSRICHLCNSYKDDLYESKSLFDNYVTQSDNEKE